MALTEKKYNTFEDFIGSSVADLFVANTTSLEPGAKSTKSALAAIEARVAELKEFLVAAQSLPADPALLPQLHLSDALPAGKRGAVDTAREFGAWLEILPSAAPGAQLDYVLHRLRGLGVPRDTVERMRHPAGFRASAGVQARGAAEGDHE